MNPQARYEDIVVQEVFDELVIYDLKRDKIHSLNPTAAFVWRHCNGQRTPAELARLLQQEFDLPQAQPLVWLALDRLEQAHLLEGKLAAGNGHQTLTRREALKMAGLAIALLPVVKSIVAPTVAYAGSRTKRISIIADCVSNPGCANQCASRCVGQGCKTGTKNCTGAGPNTCFCCCTGCDNSGNPCV